MTGAEEKTQRTLPIGVVDGLGEIRSKMHFLCAAVSDEELMAVPANTAGLFFIMQDILDELDDILKD